MTLSQGTDLQVCAERLLDDIAGFAKFGERPDGGVDRIAGSPADLEGRAWLLRRVAEAGLAGSTDEIGNVFAAAPDGEDRYLLTGSHTDTVPGGGWLDGAYGVIAALEVLRTLHENRHPAARMVRMTGFFDEEGARPDSPGGLIGSTAFADSAGIAGVEAFLELHIEQGPRMETAGWDLAVVQGIVGIDRYAVTMNGSANHAGTTPMRQRADAGMAATNLAVRLRQIAAAIDPAMVVTVGFMEFVPGAPNVIPGEARLVAEFRSGSEHALDAVGSALRYAAQTVAAAERCTCDVVRISAKPVTVFDARLCRMLETALDRAGGTATRLLSYAGHDASVLAARVPTAMIFVPSTAGVSHNPKEDTPEPQLVRGAQALLESVIEYASAKVRV
ncbi:N-carbamoyl-L-amino-acid hydrolase [Catenulispora sp. GP43]|uniref:M20/M25/M40 family metallo-hydrolase n=1 Tax=Catenulispora sp. GP43 TaxID=3156263 RepID=UPI003512B33D